jgi:ElaB/YqjD/DUF883 family membrane-anchored ribosome-binding protein
MASTIQAFPVNDSDAQAADADSADLERLTQDFRAFVTDCEQLLKDARTLSGSGAAVARAQLSERMTAARARIDAMRVTAGEQAQRVRAATEDYVRRDPLMSLAVAAAVGAIAALVLSRRTGD